MQRFASRFTLTVTVCALGLAAGALLLPTAAQGEEACEVVDRWVDEHQDELPTSMEGFQDLPPGYGPAVFTALPAELKSTIWVQHLEHFLTNEPGLTPAQIAVVQQAIDLVEQGNLYETNLQANRHPELQALMEQAQAVFEPSQVRKLLHLPAPRAQRSGVELAANGASATAFGPCDCSGLWSELDCGCTNCCAPAHCFKWIGCGPMGSYACAGLC